MDTVGLVSMDDLLHSFPQPGGKEFGQELIIHAQQRHRALFLGRRVMTALRQEVGMEPEARLIKNI